MPPPTDHRSQVNGLELAWTSAGDQHDGPALVLAHGYTGSGNDFALSLEALAARRRVVVPDHRGHGRSAKTGRLEDYSISLLADDLATLIEATTSGPVDLLGHSMGGRIALDLALGRPDLVHSLILMDTSAWSFRPDDPAMRQMMDDFITAYDPAGGYPAFDLHGPEDDLIERSTPTSWRARHQALQRGTDPFAFKALGLQLFHGRDLSVRDRLGEIACPVTVIAGEHDHPLVDQAADLAAETGGDLRIVNGAFHSPQLTHREEWEAAVVGHLARGHPTPVDPPATS